MPTRYILNSSAFHRNLNVFTQIYAGPRLDTEVFQHFVSYMWKIDFKRASVTRVCDMLVNRLPCMFPSNAWAFIFCHFWQIAEHTHIFSLPLPHKLWLHMGKHRLPQGCSKRPPTPRTPSRASRTGSRHTVSCVRSLSGAVMRRARPGVCTRHGRGPERLIVGHFGKRGPLGCVCILPATVSNERSAARTGGRFSWERRQVGGVERPFYSVSISTLNLPLERSALESKVFWCIFAIKLLWIKSFGVKIHFLFIRCPVMIREIQVEFNQPVLQSPGWWRYPISALSTVRKSDLLSGLGCTLKRQIRKEAVTARLASLPPVCPLPPGGYHSLGKI